MPLDGVLQNISLTPPHLDKNAVWVHNCNKPNNPGKKKPQERTENDEYTGHGGNPEGQTGSGGRWQKHSGSRAGQVTGVNRNKNKGNKNKKYIKPLNPNKRK